MISGIHLHILFPAFLSFFYGLGFHIHIHISLLEVIMPSPTLAGELAIALPPVIAGISRCLRGSGLPRWLNIFLAIISLIVIAIFCAWQTDGFTDFRQSTLVVLGFMTFLAGGTEMVSLFNYLETSPSPLLAVIPVASQTVPVPLPVSIIPPHAAITEPQPIILPPIATTMGDAVLKMPPTGNPTAQ